MTSGPASILVVDDDREYCRLLEQCFGGLGYRVRVVNSGREALEVIGNFVPDLVLLDVMMPGDDGFSVCRQIRGRPEFSSTIIIMFTSQSDVEDKIRGIDSGANDYVVKPSGLGELFEIVARVNRFLETQKEHRRQLEEEKFFTLRGAANTVCHEINNPLQAIHNCLHLAISRPLSEEKKQHYLMLAQEECQRLITLVQRTLEFYRPLMELFEQFYTHRFAKPDSRELYHLASDAADAIKYIETYTPTTTPPKWF